VYSLLDKKEFSEAFRLSGEGLSRCEAPQSVPKLALLWRSFFEDSRAMRRMLWWNFFECYARSATELGDEERDQVLSRIAAAPEPGGVTEARSLDMFSRWRSEGRRRRRCDRVLPMCGSRRRHMALRAHHPGLVRAHHWEVRSPAEVARGPACLSGNAGRDPCERGFCSLSGLDRCAGRKRGPNLSARRSQHVR
jgi:hypothetical protein